MKFDFEGLFDEDYLYFYESFLTPEYTAQQVEQIVNLLDLKPGHHLLDAPCGHGRISNGLAAKGIKVAGLDSCALFLEKARSEASAKEVDYRQGDMRALPWPENTFDFAINWFTSFGYFEDDENRAQLKEFRRVLKPGGTLVIDHQNRDRNLKNFQTAHLIERGDDILIDKVVWDHLGGRTDVERIIVRDGKVRRAPFSIRMFTACELTDWLRQAGFQEVRITDPEGAPFTVESRRMVARAVKPKTE